jgi:hypothetical protein
VSFGPLTVTVVVRGEGDPVQRDRHNNPLIEELDTFELTGCNLQQRTSDEELDARDTTVTTWVLFAPPPPQRIKAIDRFRIDATAAAIDPDAGQSYATFEVFGEPDVLAHIDGVTHHLELILSRVAL